MAPDPSFTVLACAKPPTRAEGARCQAVFEPASELAKQAADARAFLQAYGLWPGSAPLPVLVRQAPVPGSLTVPDLGPWLGSAWAGQPGILFGAIGGQPTDTPALLTHELVHHWLRQSGAKEARWVLDGQRASNEPALIQEGLADFVAAARSGEPSIALAGHVGPGLARSLRVASACPEALHGDAHDDSAVLSSALWAAREVIGSDVVLATIARAAPGATGRVADLSLALAGEFAKSSTESAKAWTEIAERHRLSHCADPLRLRPGERLSARRDSFVIPGPGHFTPPLEVIESPQAFAIAVPAGTPSMSLTLRAHAELPLSVRWLTTGGIRTAGELPLESGPIRRIEIPIPQGAAELVLRIASRAKTDVTFNDLTVTLARPRATPASATVAIQPARGSSCDAGCAAGPFGALPLCTALLLLFARRALRSK